VGGVDVQATFQKRWRRSVGYRRHVCRRGESAAQKGFGCEPRKRGGEVYRERKCSASAGATKGGGNGMAVFHGCTVKAEEQRGWPKRGV